MTRSSSRRFPTHRGRSRKVVEVLVIATLGLGGVAACGDSDSGAAAVSAEDLNELDDDLTALDERVGALESGTERDSPDDGGNVRPGVGLEDLLEDPQSFLGQEVTVTGDISKLWTAAAAGAAFQISPESGGAITVISADHPEQLDANDDVEVTGTVTAIRRESFEQDFGITADELLQDPDGFFTDVVAELALAAERVQVL